MKMRTCSTCNRKLMICEKNFYRDRNKLNGFETQCKNCRKVARTFKIKVAKSFKGKKIIKKSSGFGCCKKH